MRNLNHVDDYPEIPVSLASTSTVLKTGAWRSVRPVLLDQTAPCSAGCPAGVSIPAYLTDITEGRLEAAFATLIERNPFPRITGRVCPHFCEDACNLAVAAGEESISIRSIERWLGDETAHLPHSPGEDTNKHVAVVGSGPAGLAASFYLRRSGHQVTVFDSREQPGGLLRYGIPEYRLPAAIVDDEVSRLEKSGIEFISGVAIGVDLTLDDLEAEYAAVFVATGAWKERQVGVSGESLLESGLAFLEAINREDATLPGDRCAVIGGGNVAMDVARVLRRMGAEVTVVYRRSATEMPAITEEYERAVADGVTFEWLTIPRTVEKDNRGLLMTVEKTRLGEPDDSGRRRPVPTGSTKEMLFDGIFAATGETADMTPFPESVKDDDGWLAVDDEGSTADPLLFVGGDLATGPATVIEAIVAGRRAARAIDHRLGLGHLWPVEAPINTIAPTDVNPTYVRHHGRADDHATHSTPPFAEETSSLTGAEVRTEIERCLSCGHCNTCGTCFMFCPDGAITWDNGPVIDYEFCKGCGICVAECPGHGLILVNEQELTNA